MTVAVDWDAKPKIKFTSEINKNGKYPYTKFIEQHDVFEYSFEPELETTSVTITSNKSKLINLFKGYLIALSSVNDGCVAYCVAQSENLE